MSTGDDLTSMNGGTYEGLTVAICTFRRDTLSATLQSVASQKEWPGNGERKVVVVDNDEIDAKRSEIKALGNALGLSVAYVHAPARNISIARNAALNVVDSRWVAFIDDDQIATGDWLISLWRERQNHQAVIGPSIATYAGHLPRWVARCDFHSSAGGRGVTHAHTGNALLDRDFLLSRNIRFDNDLGLTGGEDTMLFRAMDEAGGGIKFCSNAIVHEPVPDSRASMKWVLRRNFRAGQTHGFVVSTFDTDNFGRLHLTAGIKCVMSLLAAVFVGPGTARSRKWLARASLHAGAVKYRMNGAILKEYA